MELCCIGVCLSYYRCAIHPLHAVSYDRRDLIRIVRYTITIATVIFVSIQCWIITLSAENQTLSCAAYFGNSNTAIIATRAKSSTSIIYSVIPARVDRPGTIGHFGAWTITGATVIGTCLPHTGFTGTRTRRFYSWTCHTAFIKTGSSRAGFAGTIA